MDDSAAEQNKDEFEVKDEKKSWSEQKAGQSCRKNGEAGQSSKLGRAVGKDLSKVSGKDSEESEAAGKKIEKTAGETENNQEVKERIPGADLIMNDFEEAEAGTKMANNLALKKMTTINDIKSDYKNEEEIGEELKGANVDYAVEFNSIGEYEFFRCEICGGPMLGHIGPKCRGLKGVRYEEPIVKAFEDWLRKNPHLKVAVHNWKEEKEMKKVRQMMEISSVNTSAAVKTVLESMESSNKFQGQTTQVVKP